MKWNTEKGATMVEGAMAALLLFAFIGGVTDFGLALQRYNYLSYNANAVGREIGTRLATSRPTDCAAIPAQLSKLNIYPGELKWSWCTVSNGSACISGSNPQTPGALSALRLTGTLPLKCYFLCVFLPRNWEISTTTTTTIDNPDAAACPEVTNFTPGKRPGP